MSSFFPLQRSKRIDDEIKMIEDLLSEEDKAIQPSKTTPSKSLEQKVDELAKQLDRLSKSFTGYSPKQKQQHQESHHQQYQAQVSAFDSSNFSNPSLADEEPPSPPLRLGFQRENFDNHAPHSTANGAHYTNRSLQSSDLNPTNLLTRSAKAGEPASRDPSNHNPDLLRITGNATMAGSEKIDSLHRQFHDDMRHLEKKHGREKQELNDRANDFLASNEAAMSLRVKQKFLDDLHRSLAVLAREHQASRDRLKRDIQRNYASEVQRAIRAVRVKLKAALDAQKERLHGKFLAAKVEKLEKFKQDFAESLQNEMRRYREELTDNYRDELQKLKGRLARDKTEKLVATQKELKAAHEKKMKELRRKLEGETQAEVRLIEETQSKELSRRIESLESQYKREEKAYREQQLKVHEERVEEYKRQLAKQLENEKLNAMQEMEAETDREKSQLLLDAKRQVQAERERLSSELKARVEVERQRLEVRQVQELREIRLAYEKDNENAMQSVQRKARESIQKKIQQLRQDLELNAVETRTKIIDEAARDGARQCEEATIQTRKQLAAEKRAAVQEVEQDLRVKLEREQREIQTGFEREKFLALENVRSRHAKQRDAALSRLYAEFEREKKEATEKAEADCAEETHRKLREEREKLLEARLALHERLKTEFLRQKEERLRTMKRKLMAAASNESEVRKFEEIMGEEVSMLDKMQFFARQVLDLKKELRRANRGRAQTNNRNATFSQSASGAALDSPDASGNSQRTGASTKNRSRMEADGTPLSPMARRLLLINAKLIAEKEKQQTAEERG